MRLILKIIALPFMLGVLYAFCKFLVIASGAVLGILSGLVFLLALGILFTSGLWGGLAWMLIAFLISPYGLPMLAAWLVGKLGGISTRCGISSHGKRHKDCGGALMASRPFLFIFRSFFHL